jgi:hypothetical protein
LLPSAFGVVPAPAEPAVPELPDEPDEPPPRPELPDAPDVPAAPPLAPCAPPGVFPPSMSPLHAVVATSAAATRHGAERRFTVGAPPIVEWSLRRANLASDFDLHAFVLSLDVCVGGAPAPPPTPLTFGLVVRIAENDVFRGSLCSEASLLGVFSLLLDLVEQKRQLRRASSRSSSAIRASAASLSARAASSGVGKSPVPSAFRASLNMRPISG